MEKIFGGTVSCMVENDINHICDGVICGLYPDEMIEVRIEEL